MFISVGTDEQRAERGKMRRMESVFVVSERRDAGVCVCVCEI